MYLISFDFAVLLNNWVKRNYSIEKQGIFYRLKNKKPFYTIC
ncbi:hypothetical protein PROVRETT_09329 [Providencia rettgeri DSM 1131]|nr:hypothetical protein PROVRETT_09329 [Providencia rettgeri DSM 1131]